MGDPSIRISSPTPSHPVVASLSAPPALPAPPASTAPVGPSVHTVPAAPECATVPTPTAATSAALASVSASPAVVVAATIVGATAVAAGDRKVWTVAETRALIVVRGGLRDRFAVVRRNRALWDEVASRLLAQFGHSRTGTQCAVRWKNVLSICRDSARGRTCEFYQDMVAALDDSVATIDADAGVNTGTATDMVTTAAGTDVDVVSAASVPNLASVAVASGSKTNATADVLATLASTMSPALSAGRDDSRPTKRARVAQGHCASCSAGGVAALLQLVLQRQNEHASALRRIEKLLTTRRADGASLSSDDTGARVNAGDKLAPDEIRRCHNNGDEGGDGRDGSGGDGDGDGGVDGQVQVQAEADVHQVRNQDQPDDHDHPHDDDGSIVGAITVQAQP